MKDSKLSSHLSGGRLNVALLQDSLRKELLNLLQQCEGTKIAIWDEWLAPPIGLIVQNPILKDYEVVNNFPLKPGVLPGIDAKHIIFITRPKIFLMDLVADYLFSVKSRQSSPVEFHLWMVPRRSELCEKQLSLRGVLGSVTVRDLRCDLYPVESDVMSMELQDDFRENYLEGDPTCLYNAAQALKTIQRIYGVIPRVFGKGQAAKQVWDLLCRLNKEEHGAKGVGAGAGGAGVIDQLLLIDRAVDFTSVLATQLTYEGLIDELYGIRSTTARFPGRKFQNATDASDITSAEDKKIFLDSSEELYAELRDKDFHLVGPLLSKKAKVMQSQLDERHRDSSVQSMKQFVQRLPQLMANKQSLYTHTNIAEYIKETTDTFEFQDLIHCEEDFLNCVDTDKASTFIDDLISQKEPLTKVLRLLCLQCVAGSGFKPKLLEQYKRELVQVYGLRTWLTLCNLERCCLLRLQAGQRQYAVLRKALHLGEESQPEGSSYLASKGTPLSVRLAEHLAKHRSWSGIQDVLGLLPGPTVDETQACLQPRVRRNSVSSDTSSLETPRVILVFFIGGCTFGEISALRTLTQQEELNVEFVVVTTKLINGKTFLETLIEPDT